MHTYRNTRHPTQALSQQRRSKQRNNSRSPIPSRATTQTPSNTSLRSVRQIIQSNRQLTAADLAGIAVAGVDAVCALVQFFGEGRDVLAAVAFTTCAISEVEEFAVRVTYRIQCPHTSPKCHWDHWRKS